MTTINTANEKTNWINSQLQIFPKSDKTILTFIANILFHNGTHGKDTIRHLFHNGYCYYFAHMLKSAFQRGIVCYAYYEGHFVWLDGTSESKDIAYDIDGVNRMWEHLIPEEKLKDGIWDFKHVPDKQSNMTDPEIMKLLLDIIEHEEYAK